MEFKLMTIATMTHKNQAKILITGSRLERFGFLPETLVTVFSDDGTLTLIAQGFGLPCYEQWVGEVRKRKGHMIQIFSWKRKKIETHLVLEGTWLEKQGFAIDDPILVRFEMGIIRIRHLPLTEMGFPTHTSATYRFAKVQLQGHKPLIRFNAAWLQDYGFLAGQTAAVSYDAGFLILKPCQQPKSKRGSCTLPFVVNVLTDRGAPKLLIMGSWLFDLDFSPGDIIIIQCHEEQLRIRRFEERYLHF